MPKLSPIKAKFLIKFLSQKGFVEIRQKGSHKFFSNTRGLTTVVPYHPAKEIRPGLLRKILNDIGVSPEEFLRSK